MITLKVTLDGNKIHNECEVSFQGKRSDAIELYKSALESLKRTDETIFSEALVEFISEEY